MTKRDLLAVVSRQDLVSSSLGSLGFQNMNYLKSLEVPELDGSDYALHDPLYKTSSRQDQGYFGLLGL